MNKFKKLMTKVFPFYPSPAFPEERKRVSFSTAYFETGEN